MGDAVVTATASAWPLGVTSVPDPKLPATVRVPRDSTAMSSLEVLPATPSEGGVRLKHRWITQVVERIIELSERDDGWDSYGSRRLQVQAAVPLLELLATYSYAIQSEPLISMTSEGGLLCAWQNSRAELELLFQPSESPMAYYSDLQSSREWDISIHESTLLEKWLWQASAMV
jgi:hypothetical protein